MDHLRIYNTLDSTNKEAQRLLNAGHIGHGTTLLAKEQTGGKGQFGRSWQAEPGRHLAMTIILLPQNLGPADLPLVSMKTALGIVKALEHLEIPVVSKIKWPNDIYVGDKKLCGILIENAIAGTKIQHIIIGIGMNINERDFPPDLPNPVSLYQITGQEHDLYQMASLIRHHVMEIVDVPDLYWKEEFDDHLYGLHQIFEFNHEGNMIRGTVEGVDEQGRLLLGLGDQQGSFYAHEIKWQVI